MWSLTYHGADGDDWSLNNLGPYVAWRQPLTPRRAEVIRALREEYELATWQSELRIGPAAARRLLDAGWDYSRARILRCFALSDETDAAAFLARSREDWDSAGWLDMNSALYGHRVLPADAARLADAGIGHAAMCDLREAGHTTVEQQIAATPPDVPDTPGRIILRPHRNASRMTGIKVTTDPELARQWVSTRRTYWWPGAVEHSPGVRPVHVVRTGGLRGGWSLWDDGALVRGADWLEIYQPERRESLSAPAPAGLPDAAAHAIGLVATCSNTACRDRAIWHPLRDAVTHAETIVEQDQSDRVSWTSTKALYRHDYTLIDGSVRSLWQLHSSEGGMSSGGDGEFDERHELWPAEALARAAYAQHSLG
ncbi:hypothetical protein [Amycolatopsis coloradensis]|uniref:hypothetical protein n=1 Tax=Amycolatopsis coloradensis TaxID=76021 RepID=UPI0011775011|nr:hypothetical protein [Amycolatopsis coloradensis]